MTRTIYTTYDCDEILKEYAKRKPVKNNKKVSYFNFPISFDIETTSCQSTDNEKIAFMYVWQVAFADKIIMGRTWEEFLEFLRKVAIVFNTHYYRRVIIWVHNLAYEFQFLRKWLEWKKVFALDERKPVYALTVSGIEFRCSYILSGYSLAKLSDNLVRYKIKKLVGDLDYTLIRHSQTPLTEQEIDYCINDVLVVNAYIQEQIENEGDITKIPLTKTGYVRRYCRQRCLNEDSKE